MCRKAHVILSLDSAFIKFFLASRKAFKFRLTISLDVKDSNAGTKSVITHCKLTLVPKTNWFREYPPCFYNACFAETPYAKAIFPYHILHLPLFS